MLQGFFQIAIILAILVAIVPFFCTYMARMFLGERTILDPIMIPIERVIYKLIGVRPQRDMVEVILDAGMFPTPHRLHLFSSPYLLLSEFDILTAL
ncbi:potassium-transporting ATPase subunit KdpA [Coleofasciculus chthonoplastes]|uniref:potassium-transporting ATPase subunit KdpA n=1 Tax=Coleofasciculus chthonoplastes TaxID=64178 RepID=UPI0032FAB2C4